MKKRTSAQYTSITLMLMIFALLVFQPTARAEDAVHYPVQIIPNVNYGEPFYVNLSSCNSWGWVKVTIHKYTTEHNFPKDVGFKVYADTTVTDKENRWLFNYIKGRYNFTLISRCNIILDDSEEMLCGGVPLSEVLPENAFAEHVSVDHDEGVLVHYLREGYRSKSLVPHDEEWTCKKGRWELNYTRK